jgi:hypothetical protein
VLELSLAVMLLPPAATDCDVSVRLFGLDSVHFQALTV